MTITNFMQADAFCLLIMTVCSLILAQEDGSLTSLTRIPVLIVGLAAFGQAMWLLGIWVPSSVGYPWPRLVFDGSLTLAAVSRTIVVLKALKLNSGRLFAIHPFGVTKR